MGLPRVRIRLRSMMVVVALIAGLAGGSIFVQRTSEAGRLDTCRTNLLGLALSLQEYASAHGTFPAGTVPNDRLPPEASELADHGLGIPRSVVLDLRPVAAVGRRCEPSHSLSGSRREARRVGRVAEPMLPGSGQVR